MRMRNAYSSIARVNVRSIMLVFARIKKFIVKTNENSDTSCIKYAIFFFFLYK